jgi:hypothetical protein
MKTREDTATGETIVEPEATENIIVRPPNGVNVGAHETHTVTWNGKAYVLPYNTPVMVPQCVIDVLDHSHLHYVHVDPLIEPQKPREDSGFAEKKSKTDDKDRY